MEVGTPRRGVRTARRAVPTFGFVERTGEACGKKAFFANFGVWIEKSPFFGLNLLKMVTDLTKSVTNKGNSATKLINSVPNQGNFKTNKGLFGTKLLNVVANQGNSATKLLNSVPTKGNVVTKLLNSVPTKGNVVTKLLNFVTNKPLFATNKPWFTAKQHCFTTKLPKSEAFITSKIAKNGVLEAEKVITRQFLGAVFVQPLVTNNNAVIESFNILPPD
jgi:hypothetical protein